MRRHAAFVLDRLLQAVICILGVAAAIFAITHLIGDPVQLLMPPEASEADRQAFRQSLGLDRSTPERFVRFVGQALQGNLGQSYRFHQPVLGLVLERFPATLELAVFAMGMAVVVGLPLGLYAGLKPKSFGVA